MSSRVLGGNMPKMRVSISATPLGIIVSPSRVRQGANRSKSAVNVPIRASVPSEMIKSSLVGKREGISRL